MIKKKDDLPAMPFYVGDWFKAPDIQCLDYDLKGIWFEMLCYMWESSERGYLLYSEEELSRLLRLPIDLLNQKLKQLLNKGIYSVRESDHAIYSRRMVRDQEIRIIRSKAGFSGGKSSFAGRFAQAKVQAKVQANTETENETILNRSSSPNFKEIEMFFKDFGSYALEAELFFNYYEGNGWKAGNTPIINWKPKAKNWILNEKTKKDRAEKPKTAPLKGFPSA